MSNTLFATYSGKIIDFTNIKAYDICLEDISHHLCNINRFGGALPLHTTYSVASHSLNCYQVAKWLYPDEKCRHKLALMHDATEAYIGDVVSGLKKCLYDYKEIEYTLWSIIKKKYNIWSSHTDDEAISKIDKRMMLTEAYYLNPERYDIYYENSNYNPYSSEEFSAKWSIKPDKYPELIKQLFLKTCEEVEIYD